MLDGNDDLVATLRKFADVAEAGEKPHWAGAMRIAATEIMELRELLTEAVALRDFPVWPFPRGEETAKKRAELWRRIESALPPNAVGKPTPD